MCKFIFLFTYAIQQYLRFVNWIAYSYFVVDFRYPNMWTRLAGPYGLILNFLSIFTKVLKDALFIFKSDITKNLEQYLLEKEKHLEETNIFDKFLLQGICRKNTSVKRKKTFKVRGNKKKKRRIKACWYFKQGFCKHGNNCKFRH